MDCMSAFVRNTQEALVNAINHVLIKHAAVKHINQIVQNVELVMEVGVVGVVGQQVLVHHLLPNNANQEPYTTNECKKILIIFN